MKKKYIILTGSKNNAGDFLIKHRAKQLFQELRPDREIIDQDRWISLDNSIDEVNQASALILCGGPSLQKHLYPNVFKMTSDLDAIKIPIISMGIGWNSRDGEWKDTYKYKYTNQSIQLLDRIENSGYLSSVRDYHSLNTLHTHGYKNFLMTGCPAYYDLNCINNGLKIDKIQKVAFSVGVSFSQSKEMENLLKHNILELQNLFHAISFEVVFHHALDETQKHHVSKKVYIKQLELTKWLNEHSIPYCDISGSAENLMNYYSNVDLHIGYRVHAHIFMNSISKFSILLCEDGRGKSVRNVIGGVVIDAYTKFAGNGLGRNLQNLFGYDRFTSNKHTTSDIIKAFEYETLTNHHRIECSRKLIDQNFHLMRTFLEQLP